MSTKNLSYELNKVATGVDKISNAVKATLGPAGKNIGIIDGSKVKNTKDGVTVAKLVVPLDDPVENYGAMIVRKAADQAVEKAGDGTTTTCVLTQALYHAAVETLANSNVPTAQFCRSLQEQANCVIASMTPTLVTADDSLFRQVISISTNSDPELTDIVYSAFKQVGKDGIITVEHAKSNSTTELVKVDGLCFDTGYLSPYFVNDPAKMRAVYEAQYDGNTWQAAPMILVYDGELNTADPIIHLMEGAMQARRPFVVIAENVSGECLATMIVNRMRAQAPFLAIKSPGYGDAKKDWLHDIAIVTGATVIDPRVTEIREQGVNVLGSCKKITSENHETTIVGFDDHSAAVQAHVDNLQVYLEKKEDNDWYKEKLEQRIARLKNGVTIIRLAAFNDVENQEKSDRLDDAIKAGKAALKEGVVPGCGIALYKARPIAVTSDLAFGKAIEVLDIALQAPVRTILGNLGLSNLSINRYLSDLGVASTSVLNIRDGFVFHDDALISGVVDPFIVVRTALQEAVSAACILINTALVVHNNPEPKCNHV